MIARMIDGPAKGQFMAFEHDRETVSVVILRPPATTEDLAAAPPPIEQVLYHRVGFAPTGEALFSSEWGTAVTPARA